MPMNYAVLLRYGLICPYLLLSRQRRLIAAAACLSSGTGEPRGVATIRLLTRMAEFVQVSNGKGPNYVVSNSGLGR